MGPGIGRAPTEGSFRALLSDASRSVSGPSLESALGLAPGSLFSARGSCNASLPPSQQVVEGSAIVQTFTTGGGQNLAFDASFLAEEARNGNLSYNDFAFVVLSGASSVIFDTFSPMGIGLNLNIPLINLNVPFEAGYQTFVYDVSAPGNDSIDFGVVDVKGPHVNTVLRVDNLRFVPEPPIDPPTAGTPRVRPDRRHLGRAQALGAVAESPRRAPCFPPFREPDRIWSGLWSRCAPTPRVLPIRRPADPLRPGGRMRRTARWLALMAVLGGLVIGLPEARAAEERPERYNLILISIDTLRADRLGSYGYDRDTSPRIDAFARKGALFENAVAESGWTLPSHVTMLSGLYPSTHGVVHPALKPNPQTALLAELLRGAGYRTIGLTEGGYVGAEYGFDRGFEAFDDADDGLKAILPRALRRIRDLGDGDRYFLFVQTYDVHCPYAPAKGYAGRFQSEGAEFIETRGRCGNPDFNEMSLSDGQVRFLSDRYDDSIREADGTLGEFLEQLETRGALANTAVVITSDHGEEFKEHGQIGHERTLYREVLSIPLIIVAPGIAPTRIAHQTGLVDLAPTVLTLLGIPVPEDMEGKSLVSLLGGGDPKDRDGARVSELSWQRPLRSVMTPELHLILDLGSDRALLFSPGEDPREARDIAGRHPKEVTALRGVLELYTKERRTRSAAMIDAVPEELRERLRALGYLQ